MGKIWLSIATNFWQAVLNTLCREDFGFPE